MDHFNLMFFFSTIDALAKINFHKETLCVILHSKQFNQIGASILSIFQKSSSLEFLKYSKKDKKENLMSN